MLLSWLFLITTNTNSLAGHQFINFWVHNHYDYFNIISYFSWWSYITLTGIQLTFNFFVSVFDAYFFFLFDPYSLKTLYAFTNFWIEQNPTIVFVKDYYGTGEGFTVFKCYWIKDQGPMFIELHDQLQIDFIIHVHEKWVFHTNPLVFTPAEFDKLLDFLENNNVFESWSFYGKSWYGELRSIEVIDRLLDFKYEEPMWDLENEVAKAKLALSKNCVMCE